MPRFLAILSGTYSKVGSIQEQGLIQRVCLVPSGHKYQNKRMDIIYGSDQEAFGCPLSQIRAQEIENLESEKMCSGFKQTDLKNIKFTLLCIIYIYYFSRIVEQFDLCSTQAEKSNICPKIMRCFCLFNM